MTVPWPAKAGLVKVGVVVTVPASRSITSHATPSADNVAPRTALTQVGSSVPTSWADKLPGFGEEKG